MAGYNTNLASEFYAISTLARLGLDVSLTLGNKKSVDIIINKEDGNYLTIDVKSVQGKMDWILGNRPPTQSLGHYYILITYDDRISDISYMPRAWVIPSMDLGGEIVKVSGNEKTHYISRKYVQENLGRYLEQWRLLVE
jgi:hypothetical protein